MKIFKQLSKKGYKHYYEGTIEELDLMDKDNLHLYSEIMQVVMWLYEKHGIWISVHLECCRGYEGYDFNFEFIDDSERTIKEQEIQYKRLGESVFNSPTEAYEAAIEYTLKNLI